MVWREWLRGPVRDYAVLVALVFFAGTSPVVTKVFRLHVSVPSVVLLAELYKLFAMLLALWLWPLVVRPEKDEALHSSNSAHSSSSSYSVTHMLSGMSWGGWWRFGIIAALYVAVNNLKTVAQLQLHPGTFSLLNNASIVTTALLYRFVLRRRMTWYQIMALVLLIMGLITSKLTLLLAGNGHHTHHLVEAQRQQLQHRREHFLTGLFVMIIASCCSSLADVGTEFLFKRWGVKHHFVGQSLMMYAWGVVLNGFVIVVYHWDNLIDEYLRIVDTAGVSELVIAATNGTCGILIGIVFRFNAGGNMTKIFADSGALVWTLFLAALLLHEFPRADVLCGIVIIYCAIILYFTQMRKQDKLNSALSPEWKQEDEKV